jgi:hypothetical protein
MTEDVESMRHSVSTDERVATVPPSSTLTSSLTGPGSRRSETLTSERLRPVRLSLCKPLLAQIHPSDPLNSATRRRSSGLPPRESGRMETAHRIAMSSLSVPGNSFACLEPPPWRRASEQVPTLSGAAAPTSSPCPGDPSVRESLETRVQTV